MKWDKHVQELVAIAASAAGRCDTCLEYHLKAAREAEVETKHILRALKLAGRIRQATSGKIDDLVRELESGKDDSTHS